MNKNRLNDKWLRIAGVLLVFILNAVIEVNYIEEWNLITVLRVLILLGSIILSWQVSRFLIIYFRRKYSLGKHLLQRILFTVLSGTVSVALISWVAGISKYIVKYGTLKGFFESPGQTTHIGLNHKTLSLNIYKIDFLLGTFSFILLFIVYELWFFIQQASGDTKRLYLAEQENEELKKISLHNQLEALKSRVNPHFLFNSLNSLSTLIEEDPQQAEHFLNELSQVYRYLLRANDHDLTTLSSELDFIRSYYHLLKIRHGNGLDLIINIHEDYTCYQIPPLTLQLLVENAVKHNVILHDKRLIIQLETTKHAQLIVKNNLQRKQTRVLSNQVGLSTIITKYRMLDQPEPLVVDNGQEFSVTLPLLNPV
ncbi:sensor histidine kinase [Xanthocytophaga flava]|uniref:sensor histidine kinase n=1 Tax=Xanthocytophaga flava TaxID=3048013 RepID=UPI0028D5C49B|nr:histidine kinase [Xanthocytophaga flavus]MDJ1468315.1 histidine kinase [Xanthocytophaga flavus]